MANGFDELSPLQTAIMLPIMDSFEHSAVTTLEICHEHQAKHSNSRVV
jgi:hypothetical protein